MSQYLIFSVFFLIVSFDTNSSLFSFCLASSFSMKLGNKSYLSQFVGVSLCGPVPVQSMCPESWGRAGAEEGGQGYPFPGHAANCHLGGRGKGRLEPEPSVSKGFSYAQRLSSPYWARQVPRCWSRTLRVGSRLVPLLVSVHPLLRTGTFAPEGGRGRGRCAGAAPGVGSHACGAALAHHQSPRPCSSSGPSLMTSLPRPDVCVVLCVCIQLGT